MNLHCASCSQCVGWIEPSGVYAVADGRGIDLRPLIAVGRLTQAGGLYRWSNASVPVTGCEPAGAVVEPLSPPLPESAPGVADALARGAAAVDGIAAGIGAFMRQSVLDGARVSGKLTIRNAAGDPVEFDGELWATRRATGDATITVEVRKTQ